MRVVRGEEGFSARMRTAARWPEVFFATTVRVSFFRMEFALMKVRRLRSVLRRWRLQCSESAVCLAMSKLLPESSLM